MKGFGLAVKLEIGGYKCKVKFFSKRNIERVIKSNVVMTGYLSNRRDYLESRRKERFTSAVENSALYLSALPISYKAISGKVITEKPLIWSFLISPALSESTSLMNHLSITEASTTIRFFPETCGLFQQSLLPLFFYASCQFFERPPASFWGHADSVGLTVLLIAIFLLKSYNFTSKLTLTQRLSAVKDENGMKTGLRSKLAKISEARLAQLRVKNRLICAPKTSSLAIAG